MAKVIEFYVPSSFTKKVIKWGHPEQRGKVIPFGEPNKTANLSEIIVLPPRTG
jgi:hypothetical protein